MKIPLPPPWWPKGLTYEFHYRALMERIERGKNMPGPFDRVTLTENPMVRHEKPRVNAVEPVVCECGEWVEVVEMYEPDTNAYYWEEVECPECGRILDGDDVK